MLLKAKILLPKFILSISIGIAGAFFLTLYRHPKELFLYADWIEAKGQAFPLMMGLLFFSLGTWLFFSTIKQLVFRQMTYSKSFFVCSVRTGLFEQIVQRLWAEYFFRHDLHVHAALIGNCIHISGEIPEGADTKDQLMAFLSQKLLSLTGYWGEICLHTTPKQ